MDGLELKEKFDRDGYVFYPGFLNKEETNELLNQISHYIHQVVPSMPSEEVFYDDKEDLNSLKQIAQLYEYDPYFKKLMFGSRFESLAAILLGHSVKGVGMQYFNKSPGVGRPTPAHQDGYYWMIEPCEGVTMWLAMDHVDEENGCVRYVRGSHKLDMRPHGASGTLGFSQTILDFPNEHDKKNEVFYRVKPGDLLVHHALTIHCADGNQSRDRTRKALGLVYYSQEAKEDTATVKAYQKKLFDALKLKGKI
jgi:phytanoyl-CoA hydroxylase